MLDLFDPGAHPSLLQLGQQLRELAGDAAYQAGHEYLRKGLVKQTSVAGMTAHATVSGSTDYRVSISFDASPKSSCTCPAHRRRPFCKHVVAVSIGLLQRPGDFVVGEAPPEVQRPKAERRAGGQRAAVVAERTALRAAGLETVDRLILELADGGLMTLGPDKLALLASAGELVRALKLRRLGNLLLALQRAAAEGGHETLDAAEFARLLTDLYLTRRASGAALQGDTALDPRLAEDLLGKTWREQDLEPVSGIELIPVGHSSLDDGEFRIETCYLADLATGTIHAEKQITPARFSGDMPPRLHRLLVDEGGLYPGFAPRRIRLGRFRRAPLTTLHIEQLLSHAIASKAELRRRLIERLTEPVGLAEAAVLFRPTELMHDGARLAALDDEGRFLPLECGATVVKLLPQWLPAAGHYAVFGLLGLNDQGLYLRSLSFLSNASRTQAWTLPVGS